MTGPFAFIRGKPYLVVNFDLEPQTLPEAAEMVQMLLEEHPPEEVLLLRPLTRRERQRLNHAIDEAEREAWAHIVVHDHDRYRGR